VKNETNKKTSSCPLFDAFILSALERMILLFWNNIKIKKTGNHNSDYGNHSKTLNFQKETSSSPNTKNEAKDPNFECNNQMVVQPNGRLDTWKRGLNTSLELHSKHYLMEVPLHDLSWTSATFQNMLCNQVQILMKISKSSSLVSHLLSLISCLG